MKRNVIVIFLLSISICLAVEFSDLRGSTNSNGETKLFFRKYNFFDYGAGFESDHDIYCFNPTTLQYYLILESRNSGNHDFLFYSGHIVFDYVLDNIINEISFSCGKEYSNEYEFGFVQDLNTYLFQWDDASIYNIHNSNQNPLTLYATHKEWPFIYRVLKSEDGGISWTSIENAPEYILRAIDPQNDQILYCANLNEELYKSTDGGISFTLVNNSQTLDWNYHFREKWESLDFVFDNDNMHIYVTVKGNSQNPYNFVVSNDNGSNWNIVSSEYCPIYIDVDLTQSGVVYKGVNSDIFVSYDYGNSFTMFQNLDYNITGLFQVDGTDTIYTITENYLFEVTSSSVNMLLTFVDSDEETISFIEHNYLSNYPNPFNPSTTIKFSIQNDSKIELSIYNIKGQKIKSLVQNDFTKGSHSIVWNGDDELGNSVSSGVYLYKLNVDGKNEAVKKCLLLK